MKILVLGATGLIGSHVTHALKAAGHDVIGTSRNTTKCPPSIEWRELDFKYMTNPQVWFPHLVGIDAVINCVGIIRESRKGDFDDLHRAAPIALFTACEQRNIQRVIQLSALGSKSDAAVPYWRSKGAAEADLLQRKLRATIIRPSLVYGDHGASSQMFLMLATLPCIAIPMAKHALLQPIHVEDLTDAIVKLITTEGPIPREIAGVGPRPMTLAHYLTNLRQGLQAPAAVVLELPLSIAQLIARIAACNPNSALTPDSLHMLAQSADGSNTADATPLRTLLGRPLQDPHSFAKPELRANAVLAWGLPLMRITIALLWLITAWVSWFGWPHQTSATWLAACGIPQYWQEPILLSASLFDCAIGIALLVYPRRWLWPLQIAVVVTYTVIMSICLPIFWLHPFGPLSKNLPLLVSMALMWRLTRK